MKLNWIFGPFEDTVFVLLTPIPLLLTFAAARNGGWLDGLIAFVLALAMAHYLPGILRAYGDRALFSRFKVRLIVAPLFLTAVTTACAYLNLSFVFLLVGLWGAWHWLMQVYGFVRIYDAKAASTPAWLDRLLCVAWFGMCTLVLNNVLPVYVTRYYEAGGRFLPAGVFVWLERSWMAMTIGLTIFYVIHAGRSMLAKRAPNPLKWLFLAITFGYLQYSASLIDQAIVGYAMFEAWHDIQYLAIVWLFNLKRARTNPETGPFIRFLFRPRAILVVAYVGICLAFGSLTHASQFFADATAARVAASFVMAAALLHYYLDGFIWKIREKETSQALGVRPDRDFYRPPAVERVLAPVWMTARVRHAALWMLFVIPAGFLFAMESTAGVTPRLEVFSNLVKTFPDSPHAHNELGNQLQNAGRFQEARTEYERALALTPNLLPAHAALGRILTDQGDLSGAGTHMEAAVKLDPRNPLLHNNLGIIRNREGNPEAAVAEFKMAIQLDPGYALAHNNLGTVLVNQGRLEEAKAHFEQALRIAPDDPNARRNLASTEAAISIGR